MDYLSEFWLVNIWRLLVLEHIRSKYPKSLFYPLFLKGFKECFQKITEFAIFCSSESDIDKNNNETENLLTFLIIFAYDIFD